MEYQYHAQRFRYLPDGRPVGTINVGTVLYIQDGVNPFKFPDRVVCREPWRVEAWIPREIVVRDSITNCHRLMRCAGGHLALIRSLRDSRRTAHVADWLLLACADAGLFGELPKGRKHIKATEAPDRKNLPAA